MRLSRRAVVLLAAALVGPALPTFASASGVPVVTPVVRQVALAVGPTTAVLSREQLVGITWSSGDADVRLRWRTASGWTAWEEADEDSDVPEPRERAGTRRGTEALYVPAGAVAVGLRVTGSPVGLRLVRVSDGAVKRTLFGAARAHADGRDLISGIHSRADWGADESMKNGAPDYADRVDAVVVHHTAGGNDYTQAQVPSRIRADYAYHVNGRGWDDLGYNIVVDKFGGIWEGRAGGLGRATIGSHAQGFNTRTLGVSLLGDMTKAAPTPEIVRAFARVTAYAAATWHFDPTATTTLTSRGSPKFASGRKVTLHRVFGHKDTGQTACPGALYDELAGIRSTAAVLLGPAPKVLAVTVTGDPVRAPTPLVISAALNRSTPWTMAVRDSSGMVVARTAGEGSTARLEWNGLAPLVEDGPGVLPALPGNYTWAVAVDDGVHAPERREGTAQVALPLVPVG